MVHLSLADYSHDQTGQADYKANAFPP